MRQPCVRSFVRLLSAKFGSYVGRAAGSLSAARTACAMLALSLALGVLWPAVAQATTFTVTSLNDSGTGTLRAAMMSAGIGDTIVFQSGLKGTITPTSLLPEIATSLTIIGPGPGVVTITGSGQGQIFAVTGGTVNISGLTLTDGYGDLSVPSSGGNGGAIYNQATLTLSNCTISNSASGAGNPGGGIYNSGTLTVNNCTITGNTGLSGGGIYNLGTLTVTNSTISNNSAEQGGDVESYGGGISSGGPNNYGGTATVIDSTIMGNVAGIGGGFSNIPGPNDASPGGMLTVINSTFTGNYSYYEGGAIYNQYNSDGVGGGVQLYNCTLTGNTSNGYGGGGIYTGFGQVTLYNSIVAGNSATSNSDGFADIYPSYTDGGGNLADTSSSVTSPITPELAALGNYGGPTQTMPPLPGSPAMCKGLASSIKAGVTTDQRGYPNTNTSYAGYSSGSPCVDIGAVQSHYSALQFVQQPTNTEVNTAITPAPTVAVLETNANQSTNNTDALNGIPLTLVYSGGSVELSGTLTQTTAGGVATFAGLTPNTLGTGFTLSASLPVIAGTTLTGTSNPFNVSSSSLSPQTITFPNPGTKIYGVAPITLTATASSGLAVSYTPNTSAVCSVSGSVAIILNAGSCSITASQPGNSTYAAATPVEDTFSVNPALLTAACGDAEAAQGAAIVLPAATLTGVVNGDAITASCSTAATTSSPVGTYPITPVFSDPQGRLPDYEVTLNSGTLFIYSTSGAAPLIFWLSADSVNAGASGFTLSVYGANFNSKAKVLWNGAVRATTDVSSTELQATILTSDIANEGTYLITVANPAPNAATSAAQPFVAMSSTPVPAITGASISDAADGSGNHVLSLKGTDFVSGSTIEWKGAGLVTTYVSPWQVIATLPAADFGSAAVVTVVNPAPGGTSAGFDLP